MKKYAFRFVGETAFSEKITRHNFLLRCMPGTYPFQRTYAYKLTVKPFTALTHITDVYGNEMYTGTIDKKHGSFSFEATGFVLCSKYLIHEPLDRLYLYPTRLTRPTVEMSRILESAPLSEDPWNRALQLCDLTHRVVRAEEHSGHRTAAEALAAGKGDAKDLAQVLLTLCRLSGIGARFVSGLAAGIPTAHCWVEVHSGGVWRAMDPSTGEPAEDGYLKVAQGPDHLACALARSVYRSPESGVTETSGMSVQVTEHVITTRDTVPRA